MSSAPIQPALDLRTVPEDRLPAPPGDPAWALRLARTHYENFPVLGPLVPKDLRADFAAVYAFCRTADDLADEIGSDDAARARSLELLGVWRAHLRACYAAAPPGGLSSSEAAHEANRVAGAPDPGAVFGPLAATIARHRLPPEPFHRLLDAFESDQRTTHWESWEALLEYCTGSANPVGHLVLMLGGVRPPSEVPANAEFYRLSDLTCSALQLANFWQDVRRDLMERDRIYLPRAESGLTRDQLLDWAARPDDPAARIPYIRALRPLVERTRAMFAEATSLPERLPRRIGPLVWMFAAGGRRVLERIERTGCATLWTRPKLSRLDKLKFFTRAWMFARTRRWPS